ncbi:hypothetical protein BGX38DRAFT_1147109 [Terfezia claveryi]|nr:hypothetical protein BGX38DRAFT_1147109 [Terfezia claveryi]
MKEKVEYLLDGDRFIYRRAKREKYLEGRKRKGNREPDFLEKINGVLICLVATAIRHCLKAWRTGECADSVQEFKYETAWCKLACQKTYVVGKKLMSVVTYKRISKTWTSHGPRVQELIVSNVKADLLRQIAAHVKIVEIEPTDAPQPEDQGRYEAELEEELHHSYNRLNVPESKRRHQKGQLRDSSVELVEPLQQDLGDIHVDPDQTTDKDSDEEGGDNEDEADVEED